MRKLLKILHSKQKGITGLETAIILIAFVVVAAVFAYTVLSAGLFSTQKSQEAVYSGLKETQSTIEPMGSVVGYDKTAILANNGGVATGAPVILTNTNTITVTTLGGFTVTLPAGVTGTATSGTTTVTGSPLALVAGANAVTTTGITGTFTIVFNTGSLSKVDITVALASDGDPIDLTPEYTLVTGDLTQTNASGNKLQVALNNAAVTVADAPWTVAFVGKNNGDYMLERGEKAVITVWLHDYTVAGGWAAGNANNGFLAGNEIGVNSTFSIELKPAQGASVNIQRTLPAYLDTVMDLH
jgi:flagellin-like protein